MQALRVLDVSFNVIDSFPLDELPASLQFLLVKGNPCASDETRLDALDEQLRSLPNMIEVDGRRLKGASAYSETKFFSFSEKRKKKHASSTFNSLHGWIFISFKKHLQANRILIDFHSVFDPVLCCIVSVLR